MPLVPLIALVLAIGIAALVLTRARVLTLAGGDRRRLHSLPGHYGWLGFLLSVLPALALALVWSAAEPVVIERHLRGLAPAGDAGARALFLADAHRLAAGLDAAVARGAIGADEAALPGAGGADLAAILRSAGVPLGGEVSAPVLAAAQEARALAGRGALLRALATLGLAGAGLIAGLVLARPALRARNGVERVVLVLLLLAAGIAILTTAGIVLSLVTEAGRFLSLHPVTDFLFGTVWSPQFGGGSSFGLLPLLWGTLYISLISMLVAVPVGLFTAIHLAEYAGPRQRAIVKPAIEVIAGIPTIVFGLFALVTLGPALRDWFAAPMGLGTSAASVMTAGIAIGILNIPFISSLADDIINAVPQALRDGSYGLGATRSETIRQVVLPAALPGIVGAVLMAGSRAIGETMIVTLGAGAAARMSMNPFEAMTTITVKIVGQLTGDTAFDSPETLVAFALGFTLFVITLGLNIVALWIVRRYREQYE
ncbi:MAG: phosphate ABC transporter permease subunit PstC [Rubellimicrobium sp.]|nr:phosphate ABC transporter permease subunit PstC [Rubellimicrobium sp.]